MLALRLKATAGQLRAGRARIKAAAGWWPLAMGTALAVLLAGGLGGPSRAETADAPLSNPMLHDAKAIAAGEQLYREHCIICHGRGGGRGPNLFATKLSDEKFLFVVINGRKGTQMPVWGLRLSPDQVWAIHAFVKSRDSAF
jgi:mono/diheme cytochrome c family protein